MRKEITQRMEKLGLTNPLYGYVLVAAGVVFLYVSFFYFAHDLYEQFLPIPCMLFLGVIHGRRTELKNKKMLILPVAMVLWFLLIWLKQGVDAERVYSIGLFFVIYLFAFPLASLLQDGEKKHALKMFAGAYLGGAAVLTAGTILLILDLVPEYFSWAFFWDGARLQAFWHPNMTACFLMIGVVFAAAFLPECKSIGVKTAFLVLIVMMLGAMALTNCRTVLIMTGGYLGACLFFALIKRGKKWFIPGVLAAAIVTVAFFAGAGELYQANYDRLTEKHVQQQLEEHNDAAETKEQDAGEVHLSTNSPQGSLSKDLGSLNGRTSIWKAAIKAIREDHSILLWGVERPGPCVSPYNHFAVAHLHNAWMETLLGMGLPGLLLAVAFTVMTAWNCLMVLLKHHEDAWKRNTALLALLLMAASMLEAYLFYTYTDYHAFNFLFFLCAGYLAHWQEEDNRRILAAIRDRMMPRKK